MGARSLNNGSQGAVASFPHCTVLLESTSFAVFPLRSSSVLNITRRAQGCKQAGCRRRQERRSSPSDSFNSKHFTNSHEERLYPNPLGVNVAEVFLHTIGVSESLWLYRSPLPCSVPWHSWRIVKTCHSSALAQHVWLSVHAALTSPLCSSMQREVGSHRVLARCLSLSCLTTNSALEMQPTRCILVQHVWLPAHAASRTHHLSKAKGDRPAPGTGIPRFG